VNRTRIEWTEKSWNPVTGCKNGCPYCYARAISKRFRRSFEPTLHKNRLKQPLYEKKPSLIFVGSMTDLFGDFIPDAWISEVLKTIRKCPQHTFQFLTKNPTRYHDWNPWPANCWIGASATNQKQANIAVESFASAEAKIKFLSCEPLLSRIESELTDVDWLIIGACTGTLASQPEPEWVSTLTAKARTKDIPVFYKPNLDWPCPPREMPLLRKRRMEELKLF